MSGISAANDILITVAGTLGTFTITGAISPEWAVPVNTLLLIILGIVNRGIVKSVREVKSEAITNAQDIDSRETAIKDEIQTLKDNQ